MRPKRYRPVFWTKERVLARLRRAVREIYENDSSRLSTCMAKWDRDIAPFIVGQSHNRRLYPSSGAVSRACGGMQKAWKLLGYDVQVTLVNKKRKHQFTEEIDNQLREIYSRPAARFGGNNFRAKGKGVKAYAAELGIDHWILIKRASELGIARVKEKPWSDDELAALREWAHFSPTNIWKRFKERGFKRTEASIACMRKKMHALKGAPWYSGNALAALMGVDQHMVMTNWVPKGLQFILKGTTRNRSPKQISGDTRLYHASEIRRFFIEHPEEIDLLKVDKYWFLEMITGGAIKQVTPSERIGKRSEAPQPIARLIPKTKRVSTRARRKAA